MIFIAIFFTARIQESRNQRVEMGVAICAIIINDLLAKYSCLISRTLGIRGLE